MSLSAFDRLSADILSFLESYINNRGNLKEMERESGASYQLLRSQLNVVHPDEVMIKLEEPRR